MVRVLSKNEKINPGAYKNKILRNIHFCIFHCLLRRHFCWIWNGGHGKDITGYRVRRIGIVFWLSPNKPMILTYFYIFYFISPKFTRIYGFWQVRESREKQTFKKNNNFCIYLNEFALHFCLPDKVNKLQ